MKSNPKLSFTCMSNKFLSDSTENMDNVSPVKN